MRISDWSSDVCSSDLIAVERHLGVEHQQFVAVLAFANRARVDFDLLGIGAEECGIKAAKNFGRLLGEVTRQAERRGRTEERRVGKECVSPCRTRGSQYH